MSQKRGRNGLKRSTRGRKAGRYQKSLKSRLNRKRTRKVIEVVEPMNAMRWSLWLAGSHGEVIADVRGAVKFEFPKSIIQSIRLLFENTYFVGRGRKRRKVTKVVAQSRNIGTGAEIWEKYAHTLPLGAQMNIVGFLVRLSVPL